MSTSVDEALESASWDLEPLAGGRGAEGVEEMLAEIRLYEVSCPECPQGFAETA